MAIKLTAECDRCYQSSGDYGWTSANQLKRDLKEIGWVFGKSPISGPYAICNTCLETAGR